MSKVLTDPTHYSAIADAIRYKNGDTTALYTPAQMAPAIRALPAGSGPDLSGDTVTADKLLYGVTAHDASGSAVTGTLDLATVVNGAVPLIPPGFSLESVETDPSLNITKLRSFTDLSALDSAWSVTGSADNLSFRANGMKLTAKGNTALDTARYPTTGTQYVNGISIPVTSILDGAESFTLRVSTILYTSENNQIGNIWIGLKTASGDVLAAVRRADAWNRTCQGIFLYASGTLVERHGDGNINAALNSNTVEGIFTIRYNGNSLTYTYEQDTYAYTCSENIQPGTVAAVEILFGASADTSYPIPSDMRVTGMTLEVNY